MTFAKTGAGKLVDRVGPTLQRNQGPTTERSLTQSGRRLDEVTEGGPITIDLILPPHMLLIPLDPPA
ncbi:hypothetical protein [Alloyangia pacifica]|uniref:hypothetical protein n=1 Tax=Alloyangia pacifica TaxID=311180 RepID=UPI000B8564D9|nr:hypothetical protein [Alloyangia pacifica]